MRETRGRAAGAEGRRGRARAGKCRNGRVLQNDKSLLKTSVASRLVSDAPGRLPKLGHHKPVICLPVSPGTSVPLSPSLKSLAAASRCTGSHLSLAGLHYPAHLVPNIIDSDSRVFGERIGTYTGSSDLGLPYIQSTANCVLAKIPISTSPRGPTPENEYLYARPHRTYTHSK